MLIRTKIREETTAQLTAMGLFHTVSNSRDPVGYREQLPSVRVWTPREAGEELSIGVPELRSVLELVVQITIEGAQDADNASRIDEMCERVIMFLVEAPAWQTSFEKLLSLSTDIETSTDGEMRTVTATLTFTLQYAYVFITRISDRLDTMDVEVVTPGQPPGPAGEPGEENTRFVVVQPR